MQRTNTRTSEETVVAAAPPLSALVASSSVGLFAGAVCYGTLIMMGDPLAGVDNFLRAYLAGFLALGVFALIVLVPTTLVLRKRRVGFSRSMLVLLAASASSVVVVAVTIGMLTGSMANVFAVVGTAAAFLIVSALILAGFFARRRTLSWVVVGSAAALAVIAGAYVAFS